MWKQVGAKNSFAKHLGHCGNGNSKIWHASGLPPVAQVHLLHIARRPCGGRAVCGLGYKVLQRQTSFGEPQLADAGRTPFRALTADPP